ncbi:MAG: K(+)-transporting ATPase subunit C [Cytophagales bacterium]|nr:MAG: K(+)-transporting ATPase subunit C [Cytophagales bacterium]TAF59595.1 MAG: K(+)-transporting ATPase subunit C [Cytophagales bacterium]
MKNNIVPALRLTLVLLVLFCGIYTLTIWGIAKAIPSNWLFAKTENGHYENIGQLFTNDKYFWSRPSAVGYNAAGSGGSNKGPSNPDYLSEVKARIDTFMVHNPDIKKEDIPSDIVTASGSGLDPNISVKAAEVQVKRIAKVRGISETTIRQIIEQQTEKPLLGLLGTEKVNVLNLNLALDQFSNTK